MFTIYVYVLDTLADWELGYVTAELNSRRFFQKRSAGSICQNSGRFKKTRENNGRADRHSRLYH